MDEDIRGQSEVRLIEEAATRMAKRLNMTFVVDPQKMEAFATSQRDSRQRGEERVECPSEPERRRA